MLVNAAFLIIGDEILSGRTVDKNLNFLAKELTARGINLKEVRVVPDDEQKIIAAVNELRKNFHYVFTCGGIGPTHDDITSDAIAKAFGDRLVKNEEAEKILILHYGKEGVNEARLKMAFVPSKASLLDNPVSSAPGFMMENVIVMAGVPKIMQAMFFAAEKKLIGGDKVISKEIKTNFTESVIAADLTNLQKEFPNVSMGSYPFEGGTALVFRSTNLDDLDLSVKKMEKILSQIK
ncbi:MAG: competence/damage-inducible protein [Rickettsiaceae bacterium]|jgi:molybdenum cofactor synthesis domain-containing protein|nr:competence/damage-inducible protein [Rickettsiaceae bacterium]